MKTSIIILLIAAAVWAVPAAAQDADFNGFKVEGLVGYDSVGVSLDEGEFDGDYGESEDGVVYGVGFGYDINLGGPVVGIEAEYTDSSTGYDISLTNENVLGYDVTGSASLDATQDLYIGFRSGALVLPRTLMYFKVGYTKASAELKAAGTVDGQPESIVVDADFDGFRLGAGIETMFGKNFYGKLEYRYSEYSGGELEAEGEELDVDEAFDYIDLNRHQVIAALGVRF